MGGRGQSSKAGTQWASASAANGSDGKQIDLSNSPLKYGKNDASITGALRQSVDAFESQRYKNKIEFGQAIDSNGKILESKRGGGGSVKTTVWALNNADVFSHNHPREPGVLGGTFSTGDINNFANYGVRVYRAAAAEGTYSIAKGSKFDGAGLKSYFKSVYDTASKQCADTVSNAVKAYNSVAKDYRAGKATHDDYQKAWSAYNKAVMDANNKMLVDMHNGLIRAQKKYGYSYTLERR